MRSQAMASRAAKAWCRISHSPMRVPVRHSPARQCTATGPSAASQAAMKRSTTCAGGACPPPAHKVQDIAKRRRFKAGKGSFRVGPALGPTPHPPPALHEKEKEVRRRGVGGRGGGRGWPRRSYAQGKGRMWGKGLSPPSLLNKDMMTEESWLSSSKANQTVLGLLSAKRSALSEVRIVESKTLALLASCTIGIQCC